MTYHNVVSAVVRALAAETINSAGGCDFEPKVQAARVAGEMSAKESSFLSDCWVFGRLHKALTPDQWAALCAKYSTHQARKHDGMMLLMGRITSPAPRRFVQCAVATWAFPKLPGAEGKRSTSVLPAGWYEMSNWDNDGRPQKTLERWRRDVRRDLERRVDDALVSAHEILAGEGLIAGEAA